MVSATSSPLVHQFLGGKAQFGLGLEFGAQQIAGAEVNEVEFLDQEIALCSLAGPRRAEEDDVQFAHGFCSMMR